MNTETTKETDIQEEKQRLNLVIDVKKVSDCERHVTVTIPRDDIERYFAKEFDQLAPKAEVAGFRVGRAPRQLVENKFRKQVGDQVKGSLLMDSLTQIGEEQDYSAISEPDIDFEQVNIPDEGDMTYEFDIEVRPEFDLPEWKGLKLERPEHEFTDQQVDEHIAKLAVQFSDMVPVDTPVQRGDFIVCNITATHEDHIVSTAEEKTIQALPTLSLADATIEGFDSLVDGAKADDKVSTTVEISEFSDNERLQGQKVEVEFEILDVKRVEPKKASEVAEQLGIDSVDEMRQMIRTSMEEQLKYGQREKIRDQISASLTESATWKLPPDLLRRQSKRELDRAVIEMRSSGFSEDEIIARENVLRKNIMEKTERLLKEHFILEKIAEEEKIEDAPEDFEFEIARLAAQQNDSPRRIRARLERAGQMDALRNMIIERKVIDLITEHAEFKAIEYETGEQPTTSAINFFVAGKSAEAIPVAKYEDAEQKPLPTVKERD